MTSVGDTRLSDERERILVVRFSSLGDILLTAPAVRALRRRFPDAEIYLLVAAGYEDAATLIPGPTRILTFDRSSGIVGLLKLRSALSRHFSIFVDLQNSARSTFLRVFSFPTIWVKAKRYRLRRWFLVRFKWNLYREVISVPERYLGAVAVLGAEGDDAGLQLDVPQSAVDAAAQEPDRNSGLQRIILCPGARHFTKRWPSERFIEVGRTLGQNGYSVTVVGSADESTLISEIVAAIPDAVALIGRPIPEVAVAFQRSAAVVSNDSGLMHLATGVGTPVVAIFGPTVREFGFFPFRAPSRVLEQDLPCRPCSAMGSESCKEGHFRCMLDTTTQSVVRAVLELVGHGQLRS